LKKGQSRNKRKGCGEDRKRTNGALRSLWEEEWGALVNKEEVRGKNRGKKSGPLYAGKGTVNLVGAV